MLECAWYMQKHAFYVENPKLVYIMYIIYIFRTIVLIFVAMFFTTFRPLYAPAFFRWLECRT